MHPKLLKVEQLTILTNGGGPGVMAVDALLQSSGKLAELSDGPELRLIRLSHNRR